ncbi:unnamed protein product, partial [Ixodes pacificus]
VLCGLCSPLALPPAGIQRNRGGRPVAGRGPGAGLLLPGVSRQAQRVRHPQLRRAEAVRGSLPGAPGSLREAQFPPTEVLRPREPRPALQIGRWRRIGHLETGSRCSGPVNSPKFLRGKNRLLRK